MMTTERGFSWIRPEDTTGGQGWVRPSSLTSGPAYIPAPHDSVSARDADRTCYDTAGTMNYIFTQRYADDRCLHPIVINGIPYYMVITQVIP